MNNHNTQKQTQKPSLFVEETLVWCSQYFGAKPNTLCHTQSDTKCHAQRDSDTQYHKWPNAQGGTLCQSWPDGADNKCIFALCSYLCQS